MPAAVLFGKLYLLKTMIRVKVCGLTDPLNVKAISDSGTDFIGFIFCQGSPRYVGQHPDKTLFRNIRQGIRKTGVFVDEEVPRILKIAEESDLEAIQLHGEESVDYCKILKASGLIIIKTFGVGAGFDPHVTDLFSDVCDYFLFDTKYDNHGGSGNKFSWDLLGNYNFKKPFFLSGGIGPEDTGIIAAVKSPQFYAVDINSRFEISPGIKDAGKVKEFINEIRR